VIARHCAAALESAPSLAREIAGRSRVEITAKAAEWFDRASQVAQQFAAWESASALARRSLDFTEAEATLLRAERTERLAVATQNAVGIAEAELLIREAMDLYRAAGGSRSGISSAGVVLGSLLRSQTRFAEVEQLANDLLDEIGPAEDAATARLQLLRATAVLNAWDDYSRAEADARAALTTARADGDAALELEALQLLATISAERGDDASAEWQQVEQLARSDGRWDLVASAALINATKRLDDEPDAVLPALAEAVELCETHGLVESRGWCDYAAAEACFGGDRWAEAIDFGLGAISLGERHGFERLMIRSWFVLLPIARELGRDELTKQAFSTFAALRGREPDSPYARVIATAAHLHFAAAGLEPAFVPDVDDRLASFDLDHGGPSWLAAVETLVEAWIAAGQTEGALRALDVMRARLERGRPSALARAVESALRARVHVARGDRAAAVRDAEHALMLFPRRDGWWAERARRVLAEGSRERAR
jgi:tetratricopeptide (TPR) repeat protein